jgi:hypothetical protein
MGHRGEDVSRDVPNEGSRISNETPLSIPQHQMSLNVTKWYEMILAAINYL